MRNTLKSKSWESTAKLIRKCHLSLLGEPAKIDEWDLAFNSLIDSILDERKSNQTFATELYYLTVDTGFQYDLKDVLEEYFDFLEKNNAWDSVIKSCETLLNTFAWNNFKPSEYKYRIGNALMNSNRLKEAEDFGRKWLRTEPNDLFAAASNSFLLVKLGKTEEAKNIASKFLEPQMVCNSDTETVFMAAMALYDATDDKYAKIIIQDKIAEYNKMIEK